MPEPKPNNAQFAEFINRVNANFIAVKSGEYHFHEIPGFKSTLRSIVFEKVYTEVLQDPLKSQIENLLPGESLYRKRDVNDPDSRTFNIVRGINGEVQLIIEPKSKRLDNLKRDIKYVSGGFKTRKIAVRADTKEAEPYVSMVSYLENTQKSLDFFNREVKAAQIFDGKKGFSRCIFGHQAIKGNKYRMITYAPFKPATLLEYIERRWAPPQFALMTKEQRDLLHTDIVRQIIDIVQEMHKSGIEHKDIKLENFLISFNSSTNRFEVEIIDFGLCKKFGDTESICGTQHYFPPWFIPRMLSGVSLDYIKKIKQSSDPQEQKKFKKICELTETLAYSIMLENSKAKEKIVQQDALISGKHDMWSMGILLYELLYATRHPAKKMWENIKENQLLNSIFNFGDDATTHNAQTISSIDSVKKRFEELCGVYLSHLDNVSFPDFSAAINAELSIPYNSDIELLIRAFDDIMFSVPRIFNLAEVDQDVPFTDEEIEAATIDIIMMCPDGGLVLDEDDDDDDDNEEKNNVAPDVFDLISDSKDIMLGKNDFDLDEYLDSLISKRSDIENKYIKPGSAKISDVDWLEYTRWKMFLSAMLIITYKKLQAQQQANSSDRKKHKSSRVLNYTEEINTLKGEIKYMVPAMLETIGKKSFTRTYAKPPGI